MSIVHLLRRLVLYAMPLLFVGAVFTPSLLAQPLPAGVQVAIEPMQAGFTRNDKVLVKLTYTNTSQVERRLLKWDIGLEGRVDKDVLSIWFQGKELAYRGRHYKRAPATDQDYVTLQSGQSVSQIVDLQLSYAIEQAGAYRAVWRSDYESSLAGGSDSATQQKMITQEGVGILLYEDIPLQPLGNTNQGAYDSTNSLTSAYQYCTTNQAIEIHASVAVAEGYARVARDALSGAPISERPTARRYAEWFGRYDSGRWATVQNNFSRIYAAVSGQTLRFDCSCPEGTAGTYAYVYAGQPYTIYLCGAFWSAPRSGTDSKAGTIVHELSHFYVVASTNDETYGQASCRALANSNPVYAIRNADSHEYFAENSPPLSMPTGSDDPDLPPAPPPEPEPVIPSFLAAVVAFILGD